VSWCQERDVGLKSHRRSGAGGGGGEEELGGQKEEEDLKRRMWTSLRGVTAKGEREADDRDTCT